MLWSLLAVGIIFLVGFLVNHIIEYRKLKIDNEDLEMQVNAIRSSFEIYRNISDGGNENLRSRNAELLRENMQLKSIIGAYRSAYGNSSANTYSASKVPQGTIEAVKYAMKKAHPDNGGNAEDFIKYKKVYEELTDK